MLATAVSSISDGKKSPRTPLPAQLLSLINKFGIMKKIMMMLGLAIGLTVAAGSFTEAAAQTQKKGWSHKKKYAVVGAGAGAATGAIVSKKKGKGALIGGAVGAGSGYLLGRHKDKKAARKSN
jgi:hypothetical protein